MEKFSFLMHFLRLAFQNLFWLQKRSAIVTINKSRSVLAIPRFIKYQVQYKMISVITSNWRYFSDKAKYHKK